LDNSPRANRALIAGQPRNKLRTTKNGGSEKPHIDNKNGDLWALAASYVDLFPPRYPKLFKDCAKSLTYLDKLSLAHYVEL